MNLDKSKFYTLVVDESRKRKEESEFKEKERLTLVSAAREYSDNVMRDHAPRLKTKSSEKDKD